jgi:serine/threonine-protein kinase
MSTPPVQDDSTSAQPFLPAYHVLETLGEGAVATVFKVRAVRDGSLRALKALKADQASPQGVERFEDEFRILKRLHHPSLPDVFDFGVTSDGERYIVMELVGGEPLDRYFAAHKNELWLLVYELTEALTFVHEHDLLHLDLKPANVLIKRTRAFGDDEMPLVTLIDFGLSYQRDAGGDMEIGGTPHYMAPEVIRRDAKLTRAVDYYSVGVMLFQLVEGKLPFEGDLHDVLRAHLSKPISFSQRKVEYAELYPWIEKLLSKEPRERLESFQEFRRAVATRQLETVAGLERAYALGYIESLGMLGKRGVWQDLRGWVDAMVDAVTSRAAARESAPRRRRLPDETPPAAVLPIAAAGADIEAAIRQDLLAQAGKHVEVPRDTGPGERKRYVALTGPRGSGKSYLVEALRSEVRPRGVEFVSLTEPWQVDELLRYDSSRRPRAADPSAITIDRFIGGWERLLAWAERGVIVCVDDHERLPNEAREFLEYVIKRVDFKTSEGKEPGIFFVVADESPSLKSMLAKTIRSEETIVSVDIPPPGPRDVDDIVSTFHGHMAGVEQRALLARHLGANLETDGAVMMCLREAVADEDLKYELGRWHFRAPRSETKRRKITSTAYYEKVLPALTEEARELVRWLCCHRGRLTERQLGDVTGLEEDAMAAALESLRPYRVIDVAREKEHILLQFVSETVREAFYRMLDESDRKRIHQAYVDYLEGYKDERVSGLESLMFHYERAGMVRKALLTRVRAVAKAKRERDTYGLQRLCEEGIVFVRELETAEGRPRWHVERFFIKNLIDSAWATNSYAALIEHAERHLKTLNREIPVGLFYKYGYSLASSGDLKACGQMIAVTKPSVAQDAKPRNHLLLVEACMLYEADRHREAQDVLSTIQPQYFDKPALARYYLYSMLVSRALGDFDRYDRYMGLARMLSNDLGYSEFLLRVDYEVATFLLNQGKFADVKRLARKSIRLAARQRLFRSLCTMYFIASTAYHEEGHQMQALRYLDKAVGLAADIGMTDRVTGYVARYSLMYRSLGRYGPAINALDFARRRLARSSRQYLFASAILLDIYTTINSELADQQARDLEALCGGRSIDQTLALSHKFLADYRHTKTDYVGALDEYTTALNFYARVKNEDDGLRARIAMGHSYLALGELDKASKLILEIQEMVERFESNKIRAENAILRLSFELNRVASPEALRQAVVHCESYRERVGEMKNRIAMDTLLFRAYANFGQRSAAIRYFHELYSSVKEVCSNLPGPRFVDDYISRPDFVAAVERFRSLK